ncbi:hypothetical protein [Enterovirga rhinocerotis]|uniref:Uncharacterized protein n=1 Tax=Enterovirga rhinocerotis TaxID=1339210 RepID=A0A4R7BWS0_9HYPH|nr:hypothetical protein [Enterovirga rhinocerotis]TDR90350.1 hypothetical protein EV668_3201 [Enterovirga rhinocerotis]
MAAKTTTWLIRVSGYGTFEFEGTEPEAEEMRVHKCRWEGGTGMKWRKDLAREEDRIRSEMASHFDAGEGAPSSLFARLRQTLATARSKPEDPSHG